MESPTFGIFVQLYLRYLLMAQVGERESKDVSRLRSSVLGQNFMGWHDMGHACLLECVCKRDGLL